MPEPDAVIVVQQDAAVARAIAECINLLGRQTAEATSADEAMSLLRRRLFGAAVVDAKVSRAGEPLYQLLARLDLLRRLIVTGPADPAIERAARRGGADIYLVAPVTAKSLAAALGLAGAAAVSREVGCPGCPTGRAPTLVRPARTKGRGRALEGWP